MKENCMPVDFWIVDTFHNKPFCGVPAMVSFVDDFSNSQLLQNISMEINTPESIFLRKVNDTVFEAVCYTPVMKGLFFGNALYAASKVIKEQTNLKKFSINCGMRVFIVEIEDDGKIKIRFSTVKLDKAGTPSNINHAMNGELIVSLAECKNELIIEIRSPSRLKDLQPNIEMFWNMKQDSFAITADNHYETDVNYDFCAQVFAPRLGVYRSIISPIACTKLSAYWVNRFDKSSFISSGIKGETVYIEHGDEYTYISGNCVVSTKGHMEA